MILLDTSYFLALFNSQDHLHSRTADWSKSVSDRLLVTEYVLWECVNAFSKPEHRPAAHAIVNHVRSSVTYEVVPATSQLFEAGLRVHRERPDKEWSLTDCISFHIMRERGIKKALAYDHHFEQAGFEALLRREPPAKSSMD